MPFADSDPARWSGLWVRMSNVLISLAAYSRTASNERTIQRANGGLSNLERLYEQVPRLWGQWIFSDAVSTRLVRAKHGDASGVRGAAWLWPARSS